MKKAGRQETRISFPAFLLSSFNPSSCLCLNPSAGLLSGDDQRDRKKRQRDRANTGSQDGCTTKNHARGNPPSVPICEICGFLLWKIFTRIGK